VIDVHFAAANVPGCSLGAHMGHTAATTTEAPLAVFLSARRLCHFGKRSSSSRYADPMSRLERTTTDPEVCHGQPVVRELRHPVQTLLELLASGKTLDEVLADYPDSERDDLLAALEFGALTAGGRRVDRPGAA
jgi:uncharacterized protein (DUF433 family)